MKTKVATKGGCLCGRVRYEIAGPLVDADHCHCSMCRRQHGAAFATYAEFNPDDFKATEQSPLSMTYNRIAQSSLRDLCSTANACRYDSSK